MGRKSKGPWYWKARKQYVVNVGGRRYYLGPDKKRAEKKWHQIMAEYDEWRAALQATSLVALFDLFLDWTLKNRAKGTYEWYLKHLNDFAGRVKTLKADELRPYHVQEWLDTKKTSGYRRCCLTAVKRAMNWALKQGYMERNPIAYMEKPPAGRREVVVSEVEYRKAVSLASDQQFRDLMTFCWETGCRPQEAFALEARHIELNNERCIFLEAESKGGRKKRVLYLTPKSRRIVKRLMKRYPEGKLFRNANGDPWHRNNVTCRFRRMKKHLGKMLCLYYFRHTWMTRLLKAGVDPITVATLAGHSDTSMLARVYAHIQNDDDHLRRAVRRA